MSTQKKSLVSALKTTKKANVANAEAVKGESRTSMKMVATKGVQLKSLKAPAALRGIKFKSLKIKIAR